MENNENSSPERRKVTRPEKRRESQSNSFSSKSKSKKNMNKEIEDANNLLINPRTASSFHVPITTDNKGILEKISDFYENEVALMTSNFAGSYREDDMDIDDDEEDIKHKKSLFDPLEPKRAKISNLSAPDIKEKSGESHPNTDRGQSYDMSDINEK